MRTAFALILVALLVPANRATAGPLRPAVDRVIAVEGGVLMVPLQGDGSRQSWPETVPVRFDDGGRTDGRVVWLVPKPVRFPRAWSEDPRDVLVVEQRPADRPGIAPVVIAQLPPRGVGMIQIGGKRIEASWCAAPVDRSAGDLPLAITDRIDRPDPNSPLEHWRWVLLARRLGLAAPGTDRFDQNAAAVAQHQADLWSVGIERLAQHDPIGAARCVHLLTAICTDHQTPFAAWISDSTLATGLLNVLLDFRINSSALTAAAMAWADGQKPLLMWMESSDDAKVSLALANRSLDPVVAQFNWEGSDDIPIAVRVDAGRMVLAIVDRPAPRRTNRPVIDLGQPSSKKDVPGVLRIASGGRTYRLPVGAPAETARPPGAFAHRLTHPLTLNGVESGQPPADDDDHTTLVHVRRLGRRWEVFFDCRRPAGSDRGTQLERDGASIPSGVEAVVLLMGPAEHGGGPEFRLVVPETGWYDLETGDNDGSLQIFRRSMSDRWYVRLVLPDTWLHTGDGERTLFGCVRTWGDREGFAIAPGSTTSWRASTARSAIDLTRWNDLPLERTGVQ